MTAKTRNINYKKVNEKQLVVPNYDVGEKIFTFLSDFLIFNA